MAQNDMDLLAALQAAHESGDEASAAQLASMLNATPVTPQPAPIKQVPNPADQPGGANWNEKFGPTSGMSGPQKFAAGMGQSIYDTGRGLKQLVGMMSPEEVDAQRKQDAPLDKSTAGLLGNMTGTAMTTFLPGVGAEAGIARLAGTTPQALAKASSVYRLTRPIAEGAALGATGTVGTGESRIGNTALGGVSGGAGAALGKGVNTVLRAGTDNISKGAQIGADIAQKYGIPLSMPDLMQGRAAWVQSVLDKLPLSGAEDRIAGQRGAVNNALGRTMGIPNAEGAVTQDMADHAQDVIGDSIGQIAQAHNAVPTTKNLGDMMAVLQEARDTGSEEHAAAVEDKIRQLVKKVDPMTGTIPGDAWRVQNTALGRQINSSTDGDMRYYLSKLQEPYMDMMEQGMSPQMLDTFQTLRGQYRNIKTLQPLAEKAGNVSTKGIDPNLVQQRAITEGNNQGDVKELGDFAKTYLTSKYPDSGTAQRALVYGTLGGLGAGANELFGSEDSGRRHGESGLSAVAPAILGELGGGAAGRALSSQLLSKYYTSALPEATAEAVRGVTERLPSAATRGMQVTRDANANPKPAMADGGEVDAQPKKSTFWDLVQQAVKEVTGGNNGMVAAPSAPVPGVGETASGPVGRDFDNRIAAGVQASE